MPLVSSLRRLVPAVPVLSRARWAMLPLDLLDRALNLPWREFRNIPPNRMRLRVGVGNRLLFNAAHFRLLPINFWLDALNAQIVSLDSAILDIGSGCGRFAFPLREFDFHGRRFTGRYIGVDLDAEMIDWCRRHFPPDRFEFHVVPGRSKTYGTDHPSPARLPVPDASMGLVLANSLFTHLLEDDVVSYLKEAARVLRPGGYVQFSAFVIEDVRAHPDPRWTFRHRQGAAWVESPKYPEAAVAYERAWYDGLRNALGLQAEAPMAHHTHTMMRWRRP